MNAYRYTTIAVRDLPYPEGLGKSEYRDLELGMNRLLGTRWKDPATNARLFWTPPYQNLISEHLKPRFDRSGDIVTIAKQAATAARSSQWFDSNIIAGIGSEARAKYRGGLPDNLLDTHGFIATLWITHPPRIHWDGKTLSINDGRHRFSYLRSIVQPRHPDFPVLVEIESTVGSFGHLGAGRRLT